MVHLTHTTADLCQKVCVFLVNVKKMSVVITVVLVFGFFFLFSSRFVVFFKNDQWRKVHSFQKFKTEDTQQRYHCTGFIFQGRLVQGWGNEILSVMISFSINSCGKHTKFVKKKYNQVLQLESLFLIQDDSVVPVDSNGFKQFDSKDIWPLRFEIYFLRKFRFHLKRFHCIWSRQR